MSESNIKTRSRARLWKATLAAAAVMFGLGSAAGDEPAVSEELAEIISSGIRDAEPGAQRSYPEPFNTEQLSIDLAPLEEVEIKAQMDEGDTVLYSWTVQQPVYVDMHGQPLNYPEEPAVRYEEKDGVSSGHGRLTAPLFGLHGWYG